MSEYAIEMLMGDERSLVIEPMAFFQSGNNILSKFRMIVKISKASDLIFGTECLTRWQEEVELLLKVSVAEMRRWDTERSTALSRGDKRAHAHAVNKLKKADVQRRKYEKYLVFIEEAGK